MEEGVFDGLEEMLVEEGCIDVDVWRMLCVVILRPYSWTERPVTSLGESIAITDVVDTPPEPHLASAEDIHVRHH